MADTDNATNYFIRVRGRVLGPYDVAQLKTLRGRGQFGRANEVSTDRQTWQSAASIEHLFGGTTAIVTTRAASKEAASVAEPSDSGPPGRSMTPVWHYAVGDEQCGPVTLPELRGMIASNQLMPDDNVWKEGMADWIPIRDVAELRAVGKSNAAAPGSIPVQSFCYACGSPSDPRAEVCPKCGVRQQHQSGPSATKTVIGGALIYAGFWKRLAAFMVDTLLLVIAYRLLHSWLRNIVLDDIVLGDIAILGFLVPGSIAMVLPYEIFGSVFFWWLYHSLMESSSFQGTLGKLAVAAKVTDLSGQRITFGRASVRYFGKLLSGAILGVGYIMVAFTQNKQGLHDTMAGCLVVSKY